MQKLAAAAPTTGRDALRFTNDGEKPISDMTMTKLLRDDGIKGVTVHGFRSAFTDWAAEKTRFPKEVADKHWRTSCLTKWRPRIGAPTFSTSAATS